MNELTSELMAMQSTGFNWLAISVAALAAWILGAIWYGPLFARAWMDGIGKTKEQVENDYTPMKMVFALVGYFLAACGITRLLNLSFGSTWLDGVHIALLGAVCLIVPTMAVSEVMEHRPPKLFLINAGYVIVAFIIMGAIIGAWR